MTFYKGFDKDMKCKDFQYEEGKVYTIDSDPTLCEKGFHFSANITDCTGYYPNNRENKFAIVEPLGQIADKQPTFSFDLNTTTTTVYKLKSLADTLEPSDKYATNSIKIVRILTQEEVDKLYYSNSDHINLIKHLTDNYNVIIGGSFGLYLQGINLNRNLNHGVDLDIVMPYYQLIESKKDADITIESSQDKTSGSDFSSKLTVKINGKYINVDVRVDPYCKYNNTNHEDKTYKTVSILEILAAKIKYAQQGDHKHIEDIKTIINQVNNYKV